MTQSVVLKNGQNPRAYLRLSSFVSEVDRGAMDATEQATAARGDLRHRRFFANHLLLDRGLIDQHDGDIVFHGIDAAAA